MLWTVISKVCSKHVRVNREINLASPHSDRVKELAKAAGLRIPSERAAYLDEVCGGDQSLRAEVERTMLHEIVTGIADADSSSLDTHAPTQPMTGGVPVSIPPALRISSYRIVDALG